MSISYSNKVISTSEITCGDSFQVTLSLTAEPEITTNPTDIVLILDRSRSMSGSPLENLKKAADKFIDIIAETTGGTQTGEIGYGSHIGIVSFASIATQDTPLITNVATLKEAVEALTANGSTNHADAFTQATDLLANSTANEKIMIMFTDGFTTVGGSATAITDAAKAQGIIIYCIGLSGNGGIDQQALIDWASTPSSTYVTITPDDEELEKIFEDLAKNIAQPGATDIVLTDTIAPCFTITSFDKPQKGKAELLNERVIQWKIDALGETESEDASLTFTVQHTGTCSGLVEVNEALVYTDAQNHVVEFPSPEILITCPNDDECIEPCPTPIDVKIAGCQDTVELDAGVIALEGQGRIVQVEATLNNVCPHKRIALAVILTEVDNMGHEYARGTKMYTIPAHNKQGCQTVHVKCIKFILSEDTSLCRERNLKVRLLAHYIDSDFHCENMI